MQVTATTTSLDEAKELRGEVARLSSENRRLREENAQLQLDLRNCEALARYLRGIRYAPQSERFAGLVPLFADSPAAEDKGDEVEGDSDKPKEGKPRKKKRPAIPPDLPREVREHDIPADQKTCPEHKLPLERGKDKVVEKVEFIPARIKVFEDHFATYCCALCEKVVGEAKDVSPIPGSMATPSLLAHIAVSKYADGLPLYRQEKILARAGLLLSRTTMATWMVQISKLLAPLLNLFSDVMMLGPVIYIDETHHQVLNVPGKAATSKSYMWVRVGGAGGQKVVVFDFGPSRSAEVAKKLVESFTGFVTTDGYDGYNFLRDIEGIIRVQCWMHARRYFDKARKVLGKAGKGGIAEKALARIRTLYAIERSIADLSVEDRQRIRQEKSKPLLDDFHVWLQAAQKDVRPQSATGKAINYTLERWVDLTVYLQSGHLKMDNGPAENAVRPFAVGRKGWLFSDTVEGAEAMAVIYSVVETAKANGLDPFAYLHRVLEELPKAQTLEDIEALLPWATPQAPPEPVANAA